MKSTFIEVEAIACNGHDSWVFLKRVDDGTYLSAHENHKHIYWSEHAYEWEMWKIEKDNHLQSYHNTFAWYDEKHEK